LTSGRHAITAMTHPLFDLIANRPQLLADHAQAYGELVFSEVGTVSNALARRAILAVVGGILITVAVTLVGFAVMLQAAVPVRVMPAPWVLVVVPLTPVVAGFACLVASRLVTLRNPFDKVWWQLKADVAMFREATHS